MIAATADEPTAMPAIVPAEILLDEAAAALELGAAVARVLVEGFADAVDSGLVVFVLAVALVEH